MRFLCLHGGGTNADIFDIQLGGITFELAKKGHTFSFINGRIPSQPWPEFEGVFDGPFYDHYVSESAPGESLSQALEHTLRAVQAQGPFEGIIGFSQGAALACSLLASMKKKGTSLFKCSVFLCAAAPYDENGRERLQALGTDKLVDIPTAHIFGKQDEIYDQGMQLYELCEPAKAVVYDHGLGHKIPFDQERTDKIVAVIEEVIRRVDV